jgi:hypothetical protein
MAASFGSLIICPGSQRSLAGKAFGASRPETSLKNVEFRSVSGILAQSRWKVQFGTKSANDNEL